MTAVTFTNIALKNVRKKFSSYLIYFFSTSFSVMIFNLFCSMYYNPTFENYRFGTGKMSVLFRGAAVAVSLFAIIFVLSSGNYFIKTQKKKKPFYYRTSNFISVSQIAFRLKANSKMLAVIALLTAITITTVSASYSFYSAIKGDATECYAPFSYLAKNITGQQHDEILETISSIGDVKITAEDKIELLNVTMQNDQYAVKDQQTGEAVPGQKVNAYLMSESMYLKIISETHTAKGSYSETRTDFTGGLND